MANRLLTGNVLAAVLEGAAEGCESLVADEDRGIAIAMAEVLMEVAEIARDHGETPVTIDITIGPDPMEGGDRG